MPRDLRGESRPAGSGTADRNRRLCLCLCLCLCLGACNKSEFRFAFGGRKVD
jgi:hypothetical protein